MSSLLLFFKIATLCFVFMMMTGSPMHGGVPEGWWISLSVFLSWSLWAGGDTCVPEGWLTSHIRFALCLVFVFKRVGGCPVSVWCMCFRGLVG